MDRREFVKMLGAGGLLVGLGALVGMGCAEEEPPDEPMLDPDAPPPEAEPAEPAEPTEPADDEEAEDEEPTEDEEPADE